MSLITDVVIHASYLDEAVEKQLLSPLPFDFERKQSFKKVNVDVTGGSKVFCDSVYVASFNYVMPGDLFRWLHHLRLGNATVSVNCEGNWSIWQSIEKCCSGCGEIE